MRYAIFNMNCSLDGERPEPVGKICVDKEASRDGSKGKITSFGDAVLVGGVRNGLLVCNAMFFAEISESSSGKFRGVIDSENRYFLLTEVFRDRAEIDEMLGGFFARLHKVERNITGIATDEKNEITVRTVRIWERSANVRVYAL